MKIRRSWDRLIFIMGISIMVRHDYIGTNPRFRYNSCHVRPCIKGIMCIFVQLDLGILKSGGRYIGIQMRLLSAARAPEYLQTCSSKQQARLWTYARLLRRYGYVTSINYGIAPELFSYIRKTVMLICSIGNLYAKNRNLAFVLMFVLVHVVDKVIIIFE